MREDSRASECVKASRTIAVVYSETVFILLVCPVFLIVDIVPLLKLLVRQVNNSFLLLGVVRKSESLVPIIDLCDFNNILEISEVLYDRLLFDFGLLLLFRLC